MEKTKIRIKISSFNIILESRILKGLLLILSTSRLKHLCIISFKLPNASKNLKIEAIRIFKPNLKRSFDIVDF